MCFSGKSGVLKLPKRCPFLWTTMQGKILTCANLIERGIVFGGLILHVLDVRVRMWTLCSLE